MVGRLEKSVCKAMLEQYFCSNFQTELKVVKLIRQKNLVIVFEAKHLIETKNPSSNKKLKTSYFLIRDRFRGETLPIKN